MAFISAACAYVSSNYFSSKVFSSSSFKARAELCLTTSSFSVLMATFCSSIILLLFGCSLYLVSSSNVWLSIMLSYWFRWWAFRFCPLLLTWSDKSWMAKNVAGTCYGRVAANGNDSTAATVGIWTGLIMDIIGCWFEKSISPAKVFLCPYRGDSASISD